jgi:2-dehydro-3-deoxy-D-arabinonate dehydratase
MRYYQVGEGADRRLVVGTADGRFDLTAAAPELRTFGDLLRTASAVDSTPDEVASARLSAAPPVDADDLRERRTVPVDVDEVWACGVTYEISEQAREEESDMPDIYLDAYEADRPEVFFKATPSRVVGPGDDVGVRADSTWDVPEPELGIVLYRGDPVGYTVGDDVSSRSIEGANPLYLPQAKTYERCCAIGPCVSTDVDDPHSLDLRMSIDRDGETVYDDATSTAEMVRTCSELVSYFTRHNTVPELAVLLTGTSLVPEEFTLEPGDRIEIEIEDVGVLDTGVVEV